MLGHQHMGVNRESETQPLALRFALWTGLTLSLLAWFTGWVSAPGGGSLSGDTLLLVPIALAAFVQLKTLREVALALEPNGVGP